MQTKITLTLLLLVAAAVGFPSMSLGLDEPAGKALFVKSNCSTCHSVKSEGIEAKRDMAKAPDMSNAATLIPSADWAKKFVLREETKDGKKHLKPYKGSDKDLEKIIDWLMTLKAS